MKHIITTLLLLLALATSASARIRYVDGSGKLPGSFKTIQSAIDAAIDGDTVRIFPNTYSESINIYKNIVVQGGGLNTVITGRALDTATVVMSAGKLMWVSVTSSSGEGIAMSNATLANSLIFDCAFDGVSILGTGAIINNSISLNNAHSGFGIRVQSGVMIVTNCVSLSNKWQGYDDNNYNSITSQVRYSDGFGNRANNLYGGITYTNCQQVDPGFSTGNWYLSNSSQLKSAGDPTLFNLDGTQSDMGYYGGPDAPLLPYVTLPQSFMLNTDGTMQFNLTGKVGY